MPKPRKASGVSPKSRSYRLPTHHPSGSLSSSFPLSNAGIPRPIRKPRKILYLVVIFFLLYWFGIRHGLGIERIPPPPLGFAVKGGRRGRKGSLVWGRNGMAVLSPNPLAKRQEHPIYELMERAEDKWNNLLRSQSKTLQQAVQEYKKRYGLHPPAGFDAWFEFCKKHNVKIVDNYDQMMKDLLPHHALEPELFIKRSQELEGTTFTYTLDVTPDQVELTGERSWSARPKHIQSLIDGFKEFLPADFKLRVSGSDHDTGSVILGRDQRSRAMQLVKEGKREWLSLSPRGVPC
jgi:hypothetical protein